MKIIAENMRSIIISGIVVAALMGMIVLTILPLIGTNAAVEIKARDYTAYQDTKKLVEVSNRPTPKITYNQGNRWKAGDTIQIDQAFVAKDTDGNNLAIRVLQLKDVEGNDIMENHQDGAVTFETAGRYFFKLRSTDHEKKVVTTEIALVVDN